MASLRYKPVWIVFLIAGVLISFQWLSANAHASDAAQFEEGAILYTENCAVCHGERGEGRVGATLAKNWPSIQPSMAVKSIIEDGIAGSVMPAWEGTLSETQINAIVAYILSWQSGENVPLPTQVVISRPPITPPAGVTGDPNSGAVLFDENCTFCHGPNGEGRIAPALNIDWDSSRPDLFIQQTIQDGIQGSTMPAWSQANGGPLTDDNINDLVSFILSWPGAQVAQPTPTPEEPTLSTAQGVFLAGLCLVVLAAIIGGILLIQSRRKEE